jgi:hypothetical protein
LLKFTTLTPVYRNITIRNIVGTAKKSLIRAEGIPESPIASVIIENADLTGPDGVMFRDADEIILRDCKFHSDKGLIFDLRNVQNFQTQRCTITTDNPPKVRVAEETCKNIDLREIKLGDASQDLALEVVDGAKAASIQLPQK